MNIYMQNKVTSYFEVEFYHVVHNVCEILHCVLLGSYKNSENACTYSL